MAQGEARLLINVRSNCSWDGVTPRSECKKPFGVHTKGLLARDVAPRAGLEPATSRLQGLPIFREGLDYLFTRLRVQERVSGASEALLGRLLSL